MRPPEVYRAIRAISADIAETGLPKQNFNLSDDYFYRSIDDVVGCLAPLLARHALCVLPRAIERTSAERIVHPRAVWTHVSVQVAYDLVSTEDGSQHTIEAFGEALDETDKATSKAMSAAYKSAMLQAFCIPVVGGDDPDRSEGAKSHPHQTQPPQGWQQWCADFIDLIRACESKEAVGRLQDSNRGLLKCLQRERRDLYQTVGNESINRVAALAGSQCKPSALSTKPHKAPQPTENQAKNSGNA